VCDGRHTKVWVDQGGSSGSRFIREKFDNWEPHPKQCLSAVKRVWSVTACFLVTLNVDDDDDEPNFF